MITTVNNNIENINQANSLQSVTISCENRDNGNAFGRQTLRNVYFRVNVPHYCDALYSHDEEFQRKQREAVTAYYSEIIKLLEADGWTLKGNYGNGTAPTMTKDSQSLYCHPQEISGNVNDANTKHIAEVLANGTTFKHYHTDLYESIIVTTSDEDEHELYEQNYDATIREKLQEVFSTPRRNLYKPTNIAQWAVVRAIKLRTSRNNFGISGNDPVCKYVNEKYNEALADGWIIEDKGKDGQEIARWLNKAETKAKEKADHEKTATLQQASEITDAEGFNVGDKVKHNWFDDVATITAKRQVYIKYKFGFCWLYTLDFGHSVTGPFGKDYNGEEFLAQALKPVTA